MTTATVLVISVQSHNAMGQRVIIVTTGLIMVFSEALNCGTVSELNLTVSAHVHVFYVQFLEIPTQVQI